MKVLLSAYACEPSKGSEPGVGWNWALEISFLGHEVWVLTRANNRTSIEAALARMPLMPNLHFLYYDLPYWARWWKRGHRGVYLYYLLWQLFAYRLAVRAHHEIGFDIIHHLTFVSVRAPSFMGNLGIPFILGPLAGGERAPWALRMGYGWRGWLLDGFRDLANVTVRLDPLIRRTVRQADRIYVTSPETRALLPRRQQSRAAVQLAIGSDGSPIATGNRQPSDSSAAPKVLYVGNLLFLKGMHLGLPAFALLSARFPEACLTLVGSGPEENAWRRLADRCGIANRVRWIPQLPRDALAEVYGSHDLFLFPSLRDSGGMVVLEAMAHRLPVVCLDIGGPAVLVDDSCGRVVSAHGVSRSQLVEGLAAALIEFASSPERLGAAADGAVQRAQAWSWRRVVAAVYQPAAAMTDALLLHQIFDKEAVH